MITIKKRDIYIILLWLMIFRFYVPIYQIYEITQFLIGLILFFIFYKRLFKIPYWKWIVFFPICIILSTIFNLEDVKIDNLMRSVTFGLQIIDSFLVLDYYIEKEGSKRLFKILFILSSIYFFIDSVQIFIALFTNTLHQKLEEASFFYGNKFGVSYMNMIFCSLLQCYLSDKKYIDRFTKRIIMFSAIIFSIYLSDKVECTTVVVALLIYLIFQIMPEYIIKLLAKAKTVLLGLIVVNIVTILFNVILSIPIVQNFIVNILHEDLTLTGRMELYSMISVLLKRAGIFGYGYGNFIVSKEIKYAWFNAQNGIAEIILNYGYLGMILFVILLYKILKSQSRINTPLLTFLYAMIAVSAIEIPFNAMFIFIMAVYALNKENYSLSRKKQIFKRYNNGGALLNG